LICGPENGSYSYLQLMSSRSIKTDEVQLHGWTPTCTPSHSEDKQVFTSAQSARWYRCWMRSSAVEGFMLAQKVWALRCALHSRQAQSIEQAFHVNNCRNGFATCAAAIPSPVSPGRCWRNRPLSLRFCCCSTKHATNA